MKVKRIIAAVVGISVTVGAAAGGIYAYKAYQKKNLVAEVTPVSYINWGYWGDSETSYGMVTNDSSQEIYLADAKNVKKVYVAEGDTVKVGDPLLEYDTAEIRIDIERKKLDINTLENEIAIANHKLEALKVAKPVDKTPPTLDTSVLEQLQQQDQAQNSITETDVNDSNIYNYVTWGSLPYGAKVDETTGEIISPAGTVDDPYIYYCNPGAYADGSFYNFIRPTEDGGDGKHVKFIICQKDANGKMAYVQQSTGETGSGTEAENGTGSGIETGSGTETGDAETSATVLVPVVDTSVTPNTREVNGNNLPAEYESGRMWYIFSNGEYVPQSAADQYMENFMDNAMDWVEPEGYTEEELAQEISDTENRLKSLDIQRRQQLLQLETLQNTASDGMVYAEVDGVVKTAGDPEEYQNDGSAFLVVTGDDGLYVTGTISELLLGDVKVGTVVTANSWESGMTFEATITEISDYPASGNAWGDGNPNVSYYSYTAYIEDSSALRNGEYVDLTISTNESEGGGIFIEKAYVREEDGKSYCMIADENGRLKKQYVVTGRTIYGQAIEIKSGLTEEDLIAFPYGKNAVEGAAVTEQSNMYY